MRYLLIAALLTAGASSPAFSQDDDVDRRVDRIEREVRALQRQVFPGGSEEYFEADIQPNAAAPATAGSPASAPITDLTDRVNSLERQLRNLTGQIEENSFNLRQLQSQVEALQAARTTTADEFGEEGRVRPPRIESPTEEPGDAGGTDEIVEDRGEAVNDLPPDAPIRREGTEELLPDDPAEADYVRGYRLWRDGDFAGARRQLQATIANHPGHRFESYARNLLGRAYLDEGKPANATEIFVRNYQEIPNGDRAGDSLFFLGVALTELNYNDRACLAFNELRDAYGAELRSDIAEQVPTAREAADCN